jgi:DNA-binding response OmpR family regulator
MKNVLIIEDDKQISDLLEIHLKDLECSVTKSFDGITGIKFAQTGTFDFIVLDILLPGLDGLEVLRNVRKAGITTPILILTSRSDEIDKVLGLELGADDYLTKPFSLREFIARVKVIFRRIDTQNTIKEKIKNISAGNMVIDASGRKVIVDGKRIELTPKEFDLLYFLASNPGKVFSRERLLNKIWGYQYGGYEHTVNSHINRLRNKIEKNITDPQFIITNWGSGYRFNEQII